MEFEWDEHKAQSNQTKHGLHFRQVIPIFFDPFRIESEDETQTEERYRLIGAVSGRVLFVVYTWRNDKIRIISARKATSNEQRTYHTDHTDQNIKRG